MLQRDPPVRAGLAHDALDLGQLWLIRLRMFGMTTRDAARLCARPPTPAADLRTPAQSLESMYLIGYSRSMTVAHLLTQARRAARLSQGALAEAAGTSRPTLSAYEHGRKSPTLDTAWRIVGVAGFELALAPKVEFVDVADDRGRPIMVPTVLPRLLLDDALATVELPLHLNWSDRGRRYDLRDRRQRARVYEIVLREGGPADVLAYVDGALLVDLWDELVLPPAVRAAWNAVITGEVDEEIA